MILEGSLSVKAALQNGRRKVHRLLIDEKKKDRDTGYILFLAKEMNIPERQLITNGYFSKNPDKIKAVAEDIIRSGVNEILLSVDAFHQETIPLEYVTEFAKAIIGNGITFKVHPAWLVSAEDNNPYNVRTREILAHFNQIGIETAEGNVVFPSGNALKYLGEYFDLTKEIKNPYDEDPSDIRAICFSANGDILGSNIYKQDISDILLSYFHKVFLQFLHFDSND